MKKDQSLFFAFFWVICFTFLVNGCIHRYKVISTNSTNEIVNLDFSTSNSLLPVVEPYKNQLDSLMNKVLCNSSQTLEIGAPEGKLGNFIADITLEQCQKKFNESFDICILNNGGLRVPINQGSITYTDIFELLPFENELVVVEMSGMTLLEAIQHISTKALEMTPKTTVPYSGMRIRILDSNILETRIGPYALSTEKTYKVITTDYLLTGGDNMRFFEKGINTRYLNYKLRDLVIDKLQELGKMNVSIKVELDGRIEIK